MRNGYSVSGVCIKPSCYKIIEKWCVRDGDTMACDPLDIFPVGEYFCIHSSSTIVVVIEC